MMLSIAEARSRILGAVHRTNEEVVSLADAAGRVTASPVFARHTNPPQDMSAMDGYALHAADLAGQAMLRVVGTSRAGHPFAGELRPGEAVRVFTGSVCPAGTGSVLVQEEAEQTGEHLRAQVPVRAGQHIRVAGHDFRAGDEIFPAGLRLHDRAIGLAAAAGCCWLTVRRAPRIALLATGDEIVMPGEVPGPGGIINSNSHALAALIRRAGGEPVILPIAGDDVEALAAMVGRLRRTADMLVTIGGASVGDYDLVQPALAACGFSLDFWKIAMRPGKPLLFGTLGDLPVLGLPGNPVSATVCAIQFLLPALRTMLGLQSCENPQSVARTTTALAANGPRADHLRASLGRGSDGVWSVTVFGQQDSSQMRVFAQADALVLRAPHSPAAMPGDLVDILPLDRL